MASKRSAAIKLKHTKLKDKTIEGATKSFFNTERRISMAFFGLIGIILYLFITYKNGSLSDTLGEDYVNKILSKLHLKKGN